jgi:hypothetical protein
MKLKFNGILVLVVLMAQLTLRKRELWQVLFDNAGMPIPGVCECTSERNKIGTNTDFDGKYAISNS